MSYILEALKKSEQERQIGHVPDVSMVQESSPRAAPHKPRWVLIALILNALILVAIAVWFWRAGAVRQIDSAVAPVMAPIAVDKREAQVATTPNIAEPVASPEPAPVVQAVPRTDTLPAPVTQMPRPAPKSAVEPAPILPDQDQFETEPELPPRWQDLPLEERNSLPAPRIDVHVFAREPARRFVLINLRKYQEGDRVDEGATIESILADGIVLSYQGQRYRVDRP